jgi:hypothetical protein
MRYWVFKRRKSLHASSRTTVLHGLPRPLPRPTENVLGFESQVKSHATTDQAALQEGPRCGPTRGPYPGHQRPHEGIRDIEHDLELNAESKEEPRVQRHTNFWIAANDWP